MTFKSISYNYLRKEIGDNKMYLNQPIALPKSSLKEYPNLCSVHSQVAALQLPLSSVFPLEMPKTASGTFSIKIWFVLLITAFSCPCKIIFCTIIAMD